MCSIMDYIFDDKRLVCIFLLCWMTIVIAIFCEIGVLKSHFMSVGPSDETIFMGVPINTPYRYALVCVFTFVNTCVNDFMSDSISPWIINTITDHKTKYIPYSKITCITISQLWSFYCNIMGVFNMFLSFTQIDFIIIRTLADLTMSMYTNFKFLRHKVHNNSKYREMETFTAGIESTHLVENDFEDNLEKHDNVL